MQPALLSCIKFEAYREREEVLEDIFRLAKSGCVEAKRICGAFPLGERPFSGGPFDAGPLDEPAYPKGKPA